jgi:predicted Zn-dependent peptidase
MTVNSKSSIEHTTLPNGLRIVTNRMADVESVSMGLYIGSGSRAETKSENGIAHFIEHMLFKGTKKRNAKDIVEAIESVGGSINAYTSRELTVYHTKTLKEDFGTSLDVLTDMIQHSMLADEEFKQEQNVIIQEINQSFDSPEDAIYDDFQVQAYGDHAMGRPILGTEDTIMSMTPDHLRSFIDRHYHTGNIVLCGAGNINHAQFTEQAAHYFQKAPLVQDVTPQKSIYQGGEIKTKRDIEQMHLVLGFPGTHNTAADYYDHVILAVVFGGGMSSRLFQEVREKRGLAYSIYSYNNSYKDTGLLGVSAALNADKASDILPIIRDELFGLGQSMTSDELERAKRQIKSSLLMSQESSMARCEKLGHQMLIHGRPIPLAEQVQKIDAVTKESVSKVLDRMIAAKNPTLAALGPEKAIQAKGLSIAQLV